jgi:hypothetical protein
MKSFRDMEKPVFLGYNAITPIDQAIEIISNAVLKLN